MVTQKDEAIALLIERVNQLQSRIETAEEEMKGKDFEISELSAKVEESNTFLQQKQDDVSKIKEYIYEILICCF